MFVRRICLAMLGTICVVGVLSAGCAANGGRAPDDIQPARVEVASAARRVVEMYDERYKANEALTPDFMERRCLASERLAEAEVAAAQGDHEAAARAWAEHATRLEDFGHALRSIVDGSTYRTAIVDYYRARARLRLAQFHAGARTTSAVSHFESSVCPRVSRANWEARLSDVGTRLT